MYNQCNSIIMLHFVTIDRYIEIFFNAFVHQIIVTKITFSHFYTSFPQQSQPSTDCLANNSIRETSPHNSTILSLISSGFWLCLLIMLKTTCETLWDCVFHPPPHSYQTQFCVSSCVMSHARMYFSRFCSFNPCKTTSLIFKSP